MSELALITSIIGIGGLMIYYSSTLTEKHWPYKIIISFFFPVLFFIAARFGVSISSSQAYEQSALFLYKFIILFLRVYYGYLIMFLLWEGLVPEKQKEKLNRRFLKWVK